MGIRLMNTLCWCQIQSEAKGFFPKYTRVGLSQTQSYKAEYSFARQTKHGKHV